MLKGICEWNNTVLLHQTTKKKDLRSTKDLNPIYSSTTARMSFIWSSPQTPPPNSESEIMPLLKRVSTLQPVTPCMLAASLIGHATYYAAGRTVREGDLWHQNETCQYILHFLHAQTQTRQTAGCRNFFC